MKTGRTMVEGGAMKRIVVVTTVVLLLALAAAACGGGGAVTIPSAAELAARKGTLHAEQSVRTVAAYCALEAETLRALKPLLRGASLSPSSTPGSLRDAAALARHVAAAAPDGVVRDALLRSRYVSNLRDGVAGQGFDVGGLVSSRALLMRARNFVAAVDRIAAHDLRVCGPATS